MLTSCERNWCLVVLIMLVSSVSIFCLGMFFVIHGIFTDIPRCVEFGQITMCLLNEDQSMMSTFVAGVILSSSSMYTLIWIIRRL